MLTNGTKVTLNNFDIVPRSHFKLVNIVVRFIIKYLQNYTFFTLASRKTFFVN